MKNNTTNHLYFFVTTHPHWSALLKPDKYKDIVTEGIQLLVEQNRVVVNAFVIMPGDLHIIWQVKSLHDVEVVQTDLLNYISRRVKYDLQKNHPVVLLRYKALEKEEANLFWQPNANAMELPEQFYIQKLNDILCEPVVAGLCKNPWEYKYSFAQSHQSAA
ncbi:MAG: transposase [Agriterribacter sp.]